MRIGYHLSSEEHAPSRLVQLGQLAEEMGFTACSISDHFHPWSANQGHSPFVWSTLGGLASTTTIAHGSLVTCPTMRIHPAIVAHAAATMGSMLPERFFLALGTGERLNEHVLGEHWPPHSVRLEQLREAVEIIRRLWSGELVTFHGSFFDVENARIYDAPGTTPPIYLAAAGSESGRLAGEIGDGLVALSPDDTSLDAFRDAGGEGKPIIGMAHVCCADSADEARDVARHWWPTEGLPGVLKSELALPEHFDAAAGDGPADQELDASMVLGEDAEEHLDSLSRYAKAGYHTVFVHQVGPDQERFARFYRDSVLPRADDL